MQNLIAHFDNYLSLDPIEVNELISRVIEKTIKRKHFILQKGDVCNHYTFISSGLVRKYGIDKNGSEFNIQFAAENEWILDLGSFHRVQPSKFYIEAIEPAVILQIERKNFHYLFANYPKFDRNFRVITENKYMELENRILQNISLSAEEGYQVFLKEFPNLYNRLPNYQIASYLGITPEFLSKIRKNLSRKI